MRASYRGTKRWIFYSVRLLKFINDFNIDELYELENFLKFEDKLF